MPTKTNTATILKFRPRDRLSDEAELPVGLPPSTLAPPPLPVVTAINLADRPKVWFAIGPGRSGKTMLLRWVAETTIASGHAPPIVAAADPQNRSLKNYMEVHEPPTNDAVATARWLESLLRHTMEEQTSALVDLGGGDTALHKLIAAVPTLASEMDGAGVSPVAVYLLGPRVDDLAALASFEALGFQPPATAVVCNQGLSDLTMEREDAFAYIQRHTVYRKAIDRGAVPLWMPALSPDDLVQEIENARISFAQARDGLSPPGRTVAPLAPFDRSRVRTWLQLMAGEMFPITSWLP